MVKKWKRKTILESHLVIKRGMRLKEMKLWSPDMEETKSVVNTVWRVYLDSLLKREKSELLKNVSLFVTNQKFEKFYLGYQLFFAEFIGKSKGKSLIVIYANDILIVNAWQKELVMNHLWYILQHEVMHYFGKSHRDMAKLIDDFAYPALL